MYSWTIVRHELHFRARSASDGAPPLPGAVDIPSGTDVGRTIWPVRGFDMAKPCWS